MINTSHFQRAIYHCTNDDKQSRCVIKDVSVYVSWF